ncbi:pirin [Fibrella sp. HMF5335]|uniref:Pirin n=1 Tax=Fibrella rubiginis TaxID=2817060 RepID=A0A939GD32_9BACT|nr:pirin [Fibrella rubiginis]MBO0935315.1 pirin [Fibrella rubiginis]
MDSHTQAQLYLADRRGVSENAVLRSFHTFNFGAYTAEGREPFGSLCLLNDDTLYPGASLTMHAETPVTVLLLPIMGGLEYQLGAAEPDFLEPGQVGQLSLAAGKAYTVSNPYETEAINYLQLWFNEHSVTTNPSAIQPPFDLTDQNKLFPLLHGQSANHVYIGRYGGRQEGVYNLANATNGLFVFVLQGVFEVANRLLHAKDGLSLLDPQNGEVEFEALSDDAILLLVNVMMHQQSGQ